MAVFYKLAWEISGSRAATLVATLALALTYGYWFYSVEVEIYVPPLFFLLVATWLLWRAVRGGPTYLFWLIGLCHALASLIHQASLFIIPAFALGIVLIPGVLSVRLGRLVRYGIAIPNTEFWLAGDDGRPLGPGEVGELVVRGATVLPEASVGSLTGVAPVVGKLAE